MGGVLSCTKGTSATEGRGALVIVKSAETVLGRIQVRDTTRLAVVRQLIDESLDELPENYIFLSRDAPVGRRQEHTLTVGNVLHAGVRGGFSEKILYLELSAHHVRPNNDGIVRISSDDRMKMCISPVASVDAYTRPLSHPENKEKHMVIDTTSLGVVDGVRRGAGVMEEETSDMTPKQSGDADNAVCDDESPYSPESQLNVHVNTLHEHPKRVPSVIRSAASGILNRKRPFEEAPKGHDVSGRLLVLLTGGTIGMKESAHGFRPVPGFLHEFISSNSQFHDPAFPVVDGVFTTPVSRVGIRSEFVIEEYDPPLDSSNMAMDDWLKIAHDIERNYNYFDGFIIAHGTDTMAFTASALSFLLQHLGKPVLLTGAMVPLSQSLSDGVENLLGAITIAGFYKIPEVMIYFDAKLIRGNRATKRTCLGFDAFASYNYPTLGQIGSEIQIHWDRIRRPPAKPHIMRSNRLCRDVVFLRMFPSISYTLIANVMAPPVKGVVLETFGNGNLPDNAKIHQALKDAVSRGVIIVNVTQCQVGSVSAAYESGSFLRKLGVLPGHDMSSESAITKLAYLLGNYKDLDEVRRLFVRDLRGELSTYTPATSYAQGDSALLKALSSSINSEYAHDGNDVLRSIGPLVLCLAAEANEVAEMKSMLSLGISPDGFNQDGRSALHVACSRGNMEAVRCLIEAQANINIVDRKGRTPLASCVLSPSGSAELVALLLEHGAELHANALAPKLCRLASEGQLTTIKLFHAAGCDLGVCDVLGRTALHQAAWSGHLPLVQFLLARHVPILPDRYGRTALDDAKANAHLNCARAIERAVATDRVVEEEPDEKEEENEEEPDEEEEENEI